MARRSKRMTKDDFDEVIKKEYMNSNEENTHCDENHAEVSSEEERLTNGLSEVSITTDEHSVADIVNEYEVIAQIFSGLPGKQDIQFKILSFLPLQSVFKFKLVSKEIRRLIDEPSFAFEHSRRLSSKSPFTGLFYQHISGGRNVWDEPIFISTNTDHAGALPDSSLSFLKEDDNADYIKLIDSCNGLLLCRENVTCKLYVCNPLTKQKVFVPHPWKRSSIDNNLYLLIAESTTRGYQSFKVLCAQNYTPTFDYPSTKLWIFSSETCKWEEFKDISLPVLSHSSMIKSKVVVNDTLYWDCFEDQILVYNLNNKSSSSSGSFDLIKAPKNQLGRCLLDYNGKLLCYCHGYDQDNDDFPIWSLCCKTNHKLGWEIDNSHEEFRILAEDVRNGYFCVVNQFNPTKMLPFIQFKIVAYEPSLKTMYLAMNNMLFSYEVTERSLKWICGLVSAKRYSETCVLQYVHSLERIETEETKA